MFSTKAGAEKKEKNPVITNKAPIYRRPLETKETADIPQDISITQPEIIEGTIAEQKIPVTPGPIPSPEEEQIQLNPLPASQPTDEIIRNPTVGMPPSAGGHKVDILFPIDPEPQAKPKEDKQSEFSSSYLTNEQLWHEFNEKPEHHPYDVCSDRVAEQLKQLLFLLHQPKTTKSYSNPGQGYWHTFQLEREKRIEHFIFELEVIIYSILNHWSDTLKLEKVVDKEQKSHPYTPGTLFDQKYFNIDKFLIDFSKLFLLEFANLNEDEIPQFLQRELNAEDARSLMESFEKFLADWVSESNTYTVFNNEEFGKVHLRLPYYKASDLIDFQTHFRLFLKQERGLGFVRTPSIVNLDPPIAPPPIRKPKFSIGGAILTVLQGIKKWILDSISTLRNCFYHQARAESQNQHPASPGLLPAEGKIRTSPYHYNVFRVCPPTIIADSNFEDHRSTDTLIPKLYDSELPKDQPISETLKL